MCHKPSTGAFSKMIGIVVRTDSEARWLQAASPEFPALSEQTREIVRSVRALRHRPSPGSLGSGVLRVAKDRPLEERLFDALASVKILTSQVAMHLDGEWRVKLFRQLDSLHDLAEWELDDQPLLQSSFSTFLKAMLNIDPERRPGLGLSHSGHLVAAWTTGADRLTIEFLPGDRVRWVLSRKYDGDTERFAGETGVGRLSDGLEMFHPEHWFRHVEKNNKPTG
jgi:hypothetical protein